MLTITDQAFQSWAEKEVDPESICSVCCGLLQAGRPIIGTLKSEIDRSSYKDIFGWPVSVQLSPMILFRSYIHRISSETAGPMSLDLKEALRALIYKGVISERYSEFQPKLLMDVRFDSIEECPDELMKAVNQLLRGRNFKKFRTKQSVNIADVQQFIEFTKGDPVAVFRMLNVSTEVPNESECKRALFGRYISQCKTVHYPQIEVSLRRETLFLVGKYSKFTREFGQSQWDGNSTSVAETICPEVCKLFDSPVDKCLFSASGREDMDVRMLGSGRPFVLQLSDAKCLAPLLPGNDLLKNFLIDSGDIRVKGLRWVDKGVMDWLHWSTEQHIKIYRCVIWSEEVLPEQTALKDSTLRNKGIKILQKTPLRVLHRRTENTREKTIYSLEIERLNDHYAIVTLKASAGAYIKEFIHSDFGRTVPSFCDIVFSRYVRCDILQLDVLEVEQDEDEGYVPLWDRN
jgi:hypothetical protein